MLDTPALVKAASNAPDDHASPSHEDLCRWYELMHLGRLLDDKAPNYLKQAIGWSYHAPCAGHDGIQLALGLAFRPGKDFLFPYYRDLMTCLAAGLTAEEIILNGISKATDVAGGGRHMSNHFAKPSIGIQNVSSLTGNHTQHAVGLARAVQRYERDAVVFCSQGESSLSEGYCSESVNGADREKLPVVFVVQDNGYGISVPKRDQSANEHLCDNFSGYPNLKIIKCDGLDVPDSMRALDEAVAYARSGRGPAMVYALCVRIGSHSNSDRHELYRDEAELKAAKAQDPVPRFRAYCLEHGLTEDELKAIETENQARYLAAHDKAMAAPNPDPATIHDFVLPEGWVSEAYPDGLHQAEGSPISLITALNQTLKEEFRQNPDTFIWGQDMANRDKGGIFNVSKGMQQEFGEKRVFNAPIAEDFIVGTANGFSRLDDRIRVVVEGAEFADYVWPAAEQIVECSHDYWRTNGQFSPNITLRLASGGYIGGGLYHSQNVEGWLTTLPGIRVVVPAFADDAAGLLRTALRSRGMTLYLEPKFLYNAKMAHAVVPPDFAVPFGKARVRREGTDLTILAYGTPVHFALEAAAKLEKDGHSAEVIDLRSLSPLDTDAIVASVKKTHRVLIAHEDKVFGGFGGELAAICASECFPWLDAPVERVGSEFTPVGFNRILERATLPNADKVLAAARKVLAF
ncbi:thiamine pyrophosphate-dependent enzyme [Geothrix sp. 21YS21S-4]|uniref:alpha-ketoacid dehydrogenase subunit alpha/beta n=1 Tax=Geothrix sp. 21YS21S-4 TaxID=3068889 RepID=UPI0027B8E70A|nr:alpha-ketoacid dehydrogenase subunit alpha/beta [Geothrix sp. 21YS21S-4]